MEGETGTDGKIAIVWAFVDGQKGTKQELGTVVSDKPEGFTDGGDPELAGKALALAASKGIPPADIWWGVQRG